MANTKKELLQTNVELSEAEKILRAEQKKKKRLTDPLEKENAKRALKSFVDGIEATAERREALVEQIKEEKKDS